MVTAEIQKLNNWHGSQFSHSPCPLGKPLCFQCRCFTLAQPYISWINTEFMPCHKTDTLLNINHFSQYWNQASLEQVLFKERGPKTVRNFWCEPHMLFLTFFFLEKVENRYNIFFSVIYSSAWKRWVLFNIQGGNLYGNLQPELSYLRKLMWSAGEGFKSESSSAFYLSIPFPQSFLPLDKNDVHALAYMESSRAYTCN